MTLAQLQQQFTQALRYQNEDVTQHILADAINTVERLQIYRNHFVLSLSDVLAATYPLVRLLVGEQCFMQLARSHLLTHPPTQADVNQYGEGFSATLAKFPQVIESAPYIVDMANLEWQCDRLHQRDFSARPSHDMPRPLNELQQLTPLQYRQVVLELNPHISILTTQYAVAALKYAIDNNQELTSLAINQSEYVLIIRNLGIVTPHVVTDHALKLISTLERKQPLEKIPPNWLTHLPMLASLGAITGFKLYDDVQQSEGMDHGKPNT
ncbi:DNA-binding domain-containing protein [Vibrio olivae]|uniref:DNA-binding domain-containing protein n=1 Tax=Vibrio olivae TaxID=1243002 RepID=A0ABV5HUF3_9VIBR